MMRQSVQIHLGVVRYLIHVVLLALYLPAHTRGLSEAAAAGGGPVNLTQLTLELLSRPRVEGLFGCYFPFFL